MGGFVHSLVDLMLGRVKENGSDVAIVVSGLVSPLGTLCSLEQEGK